MGTNDLYQRFHREIVPHLDAAYNFARFLSRNPDAAQDIVQDSFLRAYRGFDGYQGGDARAWIFSIVRNCYHNWLLEGRRKARLAAPGTIPPALHGERRATVTEAIERAKAKRASHAKPT